MLKVDHKYSTDKAYQFFSKNGLVQQDIQWHCMPADTLDKISNFLFGTGLQIGSFVGISHCHLAANKNVKLLCTVDINTKHAGVVKPLDYCRSLAKYFKLSEKSLFIEGSSETVMRGLISIKSKFDFILLDGNHEESQVQLEISLADSLLKSGGYLILDDIDFWVGPRNMYNKGIVGYNKVALDSRAGLFQKV